MRRLIVSLPFYKYNLICIKHYRTMYLDRCICHMNYVGAGPQTWSAPSPNVQIRPWIYVIGPTIEINQDKPGEMFWGGGIFRMAGVPGGQCSGYIWKLYYWRVKYYKSQLNYYEGPLFRGPMFRLYIELYTTSDDIVNIF